MSPQSGGAPSHQQSSGRSPDIIVGVGASAGGVGALQQFFAHVPRDTRAAFVVVLHLSPDHESRLAEVLQTTTPLSVTTVRDSTLIQANHIYVIPPNGSLTIEDGKVLVAPVTAPEQRHAPVDILFRTLAQEHGANAAGVVLSGTGFNGSHGIKWIKEHGGLVLVQEPAEAEFADMPRNALATGLVDYSLPVTAIPDAIFRYFSRRTSAQPATSAHARDETEGLRDLLTLLRVRTGHDFSSYKQGTVHQTHRTTHARLQHADDPRVREVSPRLARRGRAAPATSCSSASPVSFAICRRTRCSNTASCRSCSQPNRRPMRCVRGSPGARRAKKRIRSRCSWPNARHRAMRRRLSTSSPPISTQRAISIAREGVYSAAEVADVSEERLRRFFERDQARYRIRRELREMVLFAHHNVIRDPPFSHLDLVVCRNVMIYLYRPLHQRLIEAFHFALRPGGYLFLGGSETADGSARSVRTVRQGCPHLREPGRRHPAPTAHDRGADDRRAAIPEPPSRPPAR